MTLQRDVGYNVQSNNKESPSSEGLSFEPKKLLPEFGVALFLHFLNNLIHQIFNILIGKGFVLGLESQRQSNRLFAFRQVFAFINVKDANIGNKLPAEAG